MGRITCTLLLLLLLFACTARSVAFIGLHSQRFTFEGTAEGMFDLYSDATLAVGSRFGVANPSTGKGTVLMDIGVRWARHSLSVSVEDEGTLSADHRTLLVLLDGKQTPIVAGTSAYEFKNLTNDCSQVAWRYPTLRLLVGTQYKLVLTFVTSRDRSVNTSYFNLQLIVPELEVDSRSPDASLVGGVLGYSADAAVLRPAARDEDVVTSTLLAADSKSSKYQARPLHCSGVTRQPETAIEVTRVAFVHDM